MWGKELKWFYHEVGHNRKIPLLQRDFSKIMKKITQAHSTYIEEAEGILKWLDKEVLVKKIVLGRIIVKARPSKSVTPIKITESTGCLLLKINSKQSHQEIRVYSENMHGLELKIKNFLKLIY
jgi:hypothetical protein